MINRIEELEALIESKKEELSDLQDELTRKENERDNVEINPDEFENSYCDMLNECYGEFMGIDADYILRQCDPTAYRCGLNDYCDSVNVSDTDEYNELTEEIEDIEDKISDIETEIEEFQEELEEIQEEEEE